MLPLGRAQCSKKFVGPTNMALLKNLKKKEKKRL
jgi:hypothetical protein